MLEDGVKLSHVLRLVAMMTVGALATSFLLMATVPGASQFAVVCGSVVAALIIALFDAGLFAWEGELE